MSFNYGKEERKWRLWKEAEEKQMRELGVDENTIEKLRVHDWAVFNSERRYYLRLQDAGTYLDELADDTIPSSHSPILSILESIWELLTGVFLFQQTRLWQSVSDFKKRISLLVIWISLRLIY